MSIGSIDPTSLSLASYSGNQSNQVNAQAHGNVVSAVSKLLGLSASQLQSNLASGQSMQGVASSKGVPSSQLLSTISASLQSSNPNLSSSQAAAIATTLAQRAGGGSSQQSSGTGAEKATNDATGSGLSPAISYSSSAAKHAMSNLLSLYSPSSVAGASSSRSSTNLMSQVLSASPPEGKSASSMPTNHSSLDTYL
jgi:hypothetical protein